MKRIAFALTIFAIPAASVGAQGIWLHDDASEILLMFGLAVVLFAVAGVLYWKASRNGPPTELKEKLYGSRQIGR